MDSFLLRRLAIGYARRYHTLGMTRWHTWTDLTQNELQHFVDIGALLGFDAIREYSSGNTDKMDLAWVDRPAKRVWLYLERETELDRAPDALKKLLSFKSEEAVPNFARIGIFGWVDDSAVESIRARIAQTNDVSPFLVISWVGATKEEPRVVLFDLWDDTGRTTLRSNCGVDCGDYWYVSAPEDF